MPDLDANQLLNEFDKAVATHLPEFKSENQEDNLSGSRLYKWKRDDHLTIYLMFYRLPKRKRFGIDVFWSTKGRLPTHLLPMSLTHNATAGFGPDTPIDGEFRFRASQLVNGTHDGSWRVGVNNFGVVNEITKQFADKLRIYLENLVDR